MGYAAIRAVAGHLPPQVEKNDMSTRAAQALGIEERHVAEPGQAASDLAVLAAEQLFSRYPEAREGIDFVLLCTQQPDYPLPSTACIVAEKLGLPKQVGALDYNLGCSGYVYGLALAKGLVEAGLSRKLLLLTSSLYNGSISSEDNATAPVFGDGSSATLIEAVESEKPLLDAFVFGTDGRGAGSIIQEVGGSRFPFGSTPLEKIQDEHGSHTRADIFMDGQEVMLFTLREVPPMVEEVLQKAGVTREELSYAVFHQPNKFMLDYVQRKCKLQKVPFFSDVRSTGNTVSASIPLGLTSIIEKNEGELSHVLLAGFGVGLSWAGCMADLSMLYR
ncbi:3-oxoacyl-ACP synthase III family protein [Selenomonas sp. KH1T6]|uniref:3-oxoacyl-ACP synthase III family protein n=1 Tax=Selenomonas sp. KH1T6 TaxID=3158784 RepID=UPI0008A784E8|nr:3-oxoacyl-[acyl-carrier-protein] synthase-3 [Selenomonas ruminantium]